MEKQSVLAFAIALCLGVFIVRATLIYDNGGVHEIHSHISDGIAVKNSPGGDTTTVNLVTGGMINWLSAIEDSEIIISGGAIFQDPFMGGWLQQPDYYFGRSDKGQPVSC